MKPAVWMGVVLWGGVMVAGVVGAVEGATKDECKLPPPYERAEGDAS